MGNDDEKRRLHKRPPAEIGNPSHLLVGVGEIRRPPMDVPIIRPETGY